MTTASLKTIGIILVTIVVVLLLYFKFMVHRVPSKEFPGAAGAVSVAVDKNSYYTIEPKKVAKYHKTTGKKLIEKPFNKLLAGGKIVNGDLILYSGKDLIWVDKDTLKPIDVMDFNFLTGPIVFLDWILDKWWIGTRGQGGRPTRVYCFDNQWGPLGLWNIPAKVGQVTGGAIFGEYLCVSVKGSEGLIVLSLPPDKMGCGILKKLPVSFDTECSFSLENGKGVVNAWGIKGDAVSRCRLFL